MARKTGATDRIYKYIRRLIETGRLRPGAMLPTVTTLGGTFQCHPCTAGEAINRLIRDGFLVRMDGKSSQARVVLILPR